MSKDFVLIRWLRLLRTQHFDSFSPSALFCWKVHGLSDLPVYCLVLSSMFLLLNISLLTILTILIGNISSAPGPGTQTSTLGTRSRSELIIIIERKNTVILHKAAKVPISVSFGGNL